MAATGRRAKPPGTSPSLPAWSEAARGTPSTDLARENQRLKRQLNKTKRRLQEVTDYATGLEQSKSYLERAVTQSLVVLEKIGPVPAQFCATHKKNLPLSAFRLRATRRGRWAVANADFDENDKSKHNQELVAFRSQCLECEMKRQGASESAHRISLKQAVSRYVDRSPDSAEKFWDAFESAYMQGAMGEMG